MSTTAEKMAKTRELINQLLAKAEATPYPAEAQTFQEHAERLMIRYGIEQAHLDAEAGKQGKPREAMVERPYTLRGVYRAAESRGFTAIARAFGTVKVLESGGRNTTTLYIIGAESDVAQALQIIESLTLQAKIAMAVWWRDNRLRPYLSPSEKTVERREFQLAFYLAAAERVAAVYGEEVAEAGPGTEIVLASRQDRAEAYTRELYPELRTSKNRAIVRGTHAAAGAGAAAGMRADVHGGRRMGADRRASLPAGEA